MSFIKNLLIHLRVSLIVGGITALLMFISGWSLEMIEEGDFRKLINYILSTSILLISAILFYRLTSILSLGWTFLNFVLNVAFCIIEVGLFATILEDTFLFQTYGLVHAFVALLESIFFAVNKVLLDDIFQVFGAEVKRTMRITRDRAE